MTLVLDTGPLPAVLLRELDPKNSPTECAIENDPWEQIAECAIETGHINSGVYGPVGGTFEVKGSATQRCLWLSAGREERRR